MRITINTAYLTCTDEALQVEIKRLKEYKYLSGLDEYAAMVEIDYMTEELQAREELQTELMEEMLVGRDVGYALDFVSRVRWGL
jgi:hypothetical protein